MPFASRYPPNQAPGSVPLVVPAPQRSKRAGCFVRSSSYALPMTSVSLTTFIDFVTATGTARLTKVRNARRQYEQEWTAAADYWKGLRDRIQQTARTGWKLVSLLADVNESKRQNYEDCVRGLNKWAGRKGRDVKAVPTGRKTVWSSGALEVAVNPELLAAEGDGRYVVKLYFKSEPLSKQKAQVALRLLRETVTTKSGVAIVDARRGKFLSGGDAAGLDALLRAEAAAFTTLWENL